MRIDILTVFPDMVAAALDHSIVRRARERGLMTIHVVNLRDYAFDRHKTTDDIPYGGGGGMVMKIEPIARALDAITGGLRFAREDAAPGVSAEPETRYSSPPVLEIQSAQIALTTAPRIVLTDPRGPRFTQETARAWAREEHLILLCGHYEGVDERVRARLITDEISIGDYILTGGELPALVIVDALTRLQPGALGDREAPDKDTFAEDLLEYPHYTRPRVYEGCAVPDILLCGHHAQIARWRRWRQLRMTREHRPDLFARFTLCDRDRALLESEEPIPPPNSRVAEARQDHPAPRAEE